MCIAEKQIIERIRKNIIKTIKNSLIYNLQVNIKNGFFIHLILRILLLRKIQKENYLEQLN
ncbi:hypothetical protein HMPREF0204_13356 [Chryseobacterium gleum ATCC 35910]|uniref:Uncharacterized protein n=1 Tax=Chryseobacterium gleum ATCC 35910 TaxID=525257 RepID=A0ABP2IKR0_CHRGE|nr:hypothetical protein HMPREF0204_13356 [Chryseobacterium gleum ATCC 35910]